MPGIEALIEKLKQQHKANAPAEQMLATLQMLQKEITGGLKETAVLGTSGVAVLIPGTPSVNHPKPVDIFNDDPKVYFKLPETEASDDEINDLLLQQAMAEKNEAALAGKLKNGQSEPKEGRVKKEKKQPEFVFGDDAIESLSDVPTFAQYEKPGKREKLPTDKPVKQLKNAIDEQDRLMFLNELFRGDEVMYERSIKTIDNFYAFAEAEFWIRRELKTKIGWPPGSAAVAKFDQLVKRRFS